jgi:hypothetical protein
VSESGAGWSTCAATHALGAPTRVGFTISRSMIGTILSAMSSG